MTATAEKRPEFFAKFYLSLIPDFYFHVDQDKKVTEVMTNQSQAFKDKWTGKHISEVKEDIKKLYKHSIHALSWIDDPEVQKNLKKKDELELSINRVAFIIENPTKDDDIQLMKKHLQEFLNQYQDVTRFLNFKRSSNFGDESVEEYFSIKKINNKVSYNGPYDKYEFR